MIDYLLMPVLSYVCQQNFPQNWHQFFCLFLHEVKGPLAIKSCRNLYLKKGGWPEWLIFLLSPSLGKIKILDIRPVLKRDGLTRLPC